MRNVLISATAVLLGATLSLTAQAQSVPGQGTWTSTLQARDLDGNRANGPEAYYDTALNITWLADANLGKGSAYDTGNANGAVTFAQAQALVGALDVGGVGGWRLPKASPVNGAYWQYFNIDDTWTGTRDQSYNITSKNSEMAYMFHVEPGNKSILDTSGKDQEGFGISNAGPFTNYSSGNAYWFGTSFDQYAGDPRTAPIRWIFYPDLGSQGWAYERSYSYAWAVHDGDVGTALAPVPESGTYQLMLAGLAALGFLTRRRRNR